MTELPELRDRVIKLSDQDVGFAKLRTPALGLVAHLDTIRLYCNYLRQQETQGMTRLTSPLDADLTDSLLLEVHNFHMRVTIDWTTVRRSNETQRARAGYRSRNSSAQRILLYLTYATL